MGPCKVISIDHGIVKLIFDKQIFSSSLNRVMKTISQFYIYGDYDSPGEVNPSAYAPDASPNGNVNAGSDEVQSIPTNPYNLRTNLPQPNYKYASVYTIEEDSTYHHSMHHLSSMTERETFSHTTPLSEPGKINTYAAEKSDWIDLGAYTTMQKSHISKSSYIIGANVVYKRNPNGESKALICPWGNHDIENDFLHTDSTTIPVGLLRLFLLVQLEHDWNYSALDVKAAYLQADGFVRDVFVRLPRRILLLETREGSEWLILLGPSMASNLQPSPLK